MALIRDVVINTMHFNVTFHLMIPKWGQVCLADRMENLDTWILISPG